MRDLAGFLRQLTLDAARVEQALDRALTFDGDGDETLLDAMRYATLGGGKRIRGALTLAFCRLCGADDLSALPHAAAVELMHAASLVHDDMPEMDNDDLRRGKPSCHKKYGASTALLCGDSLLCAAFSTVAGDGVAAARKATALLADAGGFGGIGSGQVLDVVSETTPIDYEGLCRLQRLKTGRLIRCAALLGVAAAGGNAETEAIAACYAERVGLAFQIEDDLLDAAESGSDERRGLATFLTFMTPDEARAEAARLTAEAVALVAPLPGSAYLCDLAEYLLTRGQ